MHSSKETNERITESSELKGFNQFDNINLEIKR